MPFPSPSDYLEALQDPASAFTDPDLARATVATNALGLPQPVSGAFAVVFRLSTRRGEEAVRCFLTDVPDRAARYRALARHLDRHPVPALVPFAYLPEGIRVGDRLYPVVRMPWVEGTGLDAWVERHLDHPEALRALAERWRALLRDLEAAAFVHGDLQHGNVLVTPEGALRLVDLDAASVPALRGRAGAEVGHRNYQHPDRDEALTGPPADRFPGLVIHTALLALAERPDLWTRFATGENLLFRAEDFLDPEGSALFAELRTVAAVAPLAETLARACLLPPERVPSLEAVLRGEARAERPTRRRVRRRGEPPRRAPLRLALAAGAGVLAAAAGSALAGAAGGMGALALAVVAFLGAALRAHGRLPAVRRRRRLQRDADVLARWIEDLEAERARLLQQRAEAARHVERFRRERLEELREAARERHLRHHFVGELEAARRVDHRGVVRLKAAGIRTAVHATPERVAAAKGLTSEERERVLAWRAALEARYAPSVPGALSPAEEQRLQRQVQRRFHALEADAARLAARAQAQREELARVRAQADALPAVPLTSYLAHLLGLRPLPASARTAAPVLSVPTRAARRDAALVSETDYPT